MFVVVLLKAIKKYIVVPEQWIYDVNEELLKNNGVNSNRDVLVFWSKNGVGINSCPDTNYAPNFLLEKSTIYPPPNDLIGACYIGRAIHYYGKFAVHLI